MNCPVCGIELEQGTKFCANCGASLQEAPIAAAQPAPQTASQERPVQTNATPTIPSQFKPIGAWGYVGYNLLYSIPVVGFIMLIVFALSNGNYNRRNYARSYWCSLVIAAIVFFVVFLLVLMSGNTARYI